MRNVIILLSALVIMTAFIFSLQLSSEEARSKNDPSSSDTKMRIADDTRKDTEIAGQSHSNKDNATESANELLKQFDLLINVLQKRILANGVYVTFTPDMYNSSDTMKRMLMDNPSLRDKAVDICKKLGEFHPLTIWLSNFFAKAWYDGLLPSSYKESLREYFESEDRRIKSTFSYDRTKLTPIIRSDKHPLSTRIGCVVEAFRSKDIFEDKNTLNELLELAQTSESRVLRAAILHHLGAALYSQRTVNISDVGHLAERIHDIGVFNSDVLGSVYDVIMTTGTLIQHKSFVNRQNRLELQSCLLSDMMKIFVDEKSAQTPDLGISGALQYTFLEFDWHVSSKHFDEGTVILRGDFSEDLKRAAVSLICPANLSKDESSEGAAYKRQVSQICCESLFNIKDPAFKNHVLRMIEKIGDDSVTPLLQSAEQQEKDAEIKNRIQEVLNYLKSN